MMMMIGYRERERERQRETERSLVYANEQCQFGFSSFDV